MPLNSSTLFTVPFISLHLECGSYTLETAPLKYEAYDQNERQADEKTSDIRGHIS